MEYLSGVWTAISPAVGNHLWQSTLFAAVAAMLASALRKNQARVRYRLWLAASVKFLIPFSLLVSLGGHLARPRNPVSVENGLYSVAEELSQPFTRTASPVVVPAARASRADLLSLLREVLMTAWLCGFVAALGVWWWRWRRFSAAMRDAVPVSQGREVDVLRRLEQIAGVRTPIRLLFSQDSVEPGIFGIVRPALVWPIGISQHLTDAHLEAIIAHEVWHVRRRDNLAAAVQMVVEAIFWFHPLVWWLGARLIEERERACDEEVLRLGNPPQVYAESILKTCEFCVGSPLVCISGVTGADLKSRVVRIMQEPVARKLDLGKKLVLVVAGTMAVAGPVVFGLMREPQRQAASPVADDPAHLVAVLRVAGAASTVPAFEVASIKPNKSGTGMTMLHTTPVGFSASNISLRALIQQAYGVEENQILGAPSWVGSERYDIEAKVASSDTDALHDLNPDQRRLMLQPLLADRFQLKVHTELKDLPVLVLVVAKGGPKLHEAKPGDTYPNGLKGFDGEAGGPGMMLMRPGQLTAQGVDLSFVAKQLSQQLGRTVQDQTGLTGKYDFTMQWKPDRDPSPMPGAPQPGQQGPDATLSTDSSEASIFTAVQEQLGLKLESGKAPVEVLVIDHVEAPSGN
jgi:bla regulator protein BlaR1